MTPKYKKFDKVTIHGCLAAVAKRYEKLSKDSGCYIYDVILSTGGKIRCKETELNPYEFGSLGDITENIKSEEECRKELLGVRDSRDASSILDAAQKALEDRARSRDRKKERSMPSAVKAFNALTGHNITDAQGWLFMAVLKAARAEGGNIRRMDDYIDGSAYFALYGEQSFNNTKLGDK